VYVNEYICIFKYAYIYKYTYINIYTHESTNIYVHIQMHTYIYACVHACTYAFLHIFIHVCKFVLCIYIGAEDPWGRDAVRHYQGKIHRISTISEFENLCNFT